MRIKTYFIKTDWNGELKTGTACKIWLVINETVAYTVYCTNKVIFQTLENNSLK